MTLSHTPVCPHFEICGGCSLQHLDASAYQDYKTKLVSDALEFHGLEAVVVHAPILIPAHNRRRCNLKAACIQDRIVLGYHENKSHKIVDIQTCPLVVPEIEALIAPLRKCLKNILKNKQKADLFIALSDTGIDLLMVIDGLKALSMKQSEQLIAFGMENDIARISLKSGKTAEPIVTFRLPVITYGGVPVECHADGFMQASALSDSILTKLVLDAAPKKMKRAIDLFCGRGTYTLPLSALAKVDGFENDTQALNALDRAKNKHQKPITTFNRNLFEDTLTAQELNFYDFAVINPPRSGALRQCVAIAQSKIPTVVMISCDPKTFARDTKVLKQGGYVLDSVTPVDQFLWSGHIEVVGVFVRP